MSGVFVTVGTQEPFPRLVLAVDAWAHKRGIPVLAQVGAQREPCQHAQAVAVLSQAAHAQALHQARLVVAHAGIGTIFTTLGLGKPLVVLPRRAQAGEHRNDHQLATVQALASLPGFAVALDEEALPAVLDEVWASARDGGGVRIPASRQLQTRLRRFMRCGH